MEAARALRRCLRSPDARIEDDECRERTDVERQREDYGMSRKTELEADLKRIGYQLGGPI